MISRDKIKKVYRAHNGRLSVQTAEVKNISLVGKGGDYPSPFFLCLKCIGREGETHEESMGLWGCVELQWLITIGIQHPVCVCVRLPSHPGVAVAWGAVLSSSNEWSRKCSSHILHRRTG